MALHFVVEDAHSLGDARVIEIRGREAHHAAVVRRVREGEAVSITDGRGLWITGTVSAATADRVDIAVESRVCQPQPTSRMVLVQALAKGDRDELAVQAATELGIDEIVPWQAARSVSRWDAKRASKGRERWSAIVREAAKQSHRAWIPDVTDLATTSTLIERARARNETMVVLEPSAREPLSSLAAGGDLMLVVGPEGGFSPAELEQLEGAGATLARLGETVLRTSTAGPAAIAVLSVALGRW